MTHVNGNNWHTPDEEPTTNNDCLLLTEYEPTVAFFEPGDEFSSACWRTYSGTPIFADEVLRWAYISDLKPSDI